MYMIILVKKQHSHILNELKRVVIDTHYLKQYEIMNKDQQQLYRDISNLTKAVQKLVKLIEKMAKQQL